MTIRHLTSAENVDEQGFLVDPGLVHHGTILAGRVSTLGGPVDPLTHVNRDFPTHSLGDCTIVEQLEVGAKVVIDDDHFAQTTLRPGTEPSLGKVDLQARRIEWLARFQQQPGAEKED